MLHRVRQGRSPAVPECEILRRVLPVSEDHYRSLLFPLDLAAVGSYRVASYPVIPHIWHVSPSANIFS